MGTDEHGQGRYANFADERESVPVQISGYSRNRVKPVLTVVE